MSIALERRCLIVSLAMPHAVELSTCMGVAGCGCPISSKAVRSACNGVKERTRNKKENINSEKQ